MNTIIYFSPTGNAAHLAKKLQNHLGEEETKFHPLEFTDANKLEKDKHLILIYSIHGFNAPRTVKRFVKSLPEGLFEDVSLISVGCATTWVNDAVSSDLKKVLDKKNYPIIVDQVLAMPLTFIMEFPEDVAKKSISESEAAIGKVSESIVNGEKSVNEVAFKSKLINFVGKAEDGAARFFGLELHANKNCNSCGTCVKNCPEKNIKFNKKMKPKFGLKCLMCMRCVYNCPQKAIGPRLARFIPIKNGYSITKYLD